MKLAVFKNGEKVTLITTDSSQSFQFSLKLEKVLANQIIEFWKDNKLRSDSQVNFRKSKSTTDAMLDFLSDTVERLESNRCCMATFLDLCKDFDCISHGILRGKLIAYVFNTNSRRPIRSS